MPGFACWGNLWGEENNGIFSCGLCGPTAGLSISPKTSPMGTSITQKTSPPGLSIAPHKQPHGADYHPHKQPPRAGHRPHKAPAAVPGTRLSGDSILHPRLIRGGCRQHTPPKPKPWSSSASQPYLRYSSIPLWTRLRSIPPCWGLLTCLPRPHSSPPGRRALGGQRCPHHLAWLGQKLLVSTESRLLCPGFPTWRRAG